MGKMNAVMNRLLERKPVFADLINGTVYEGLQILKAEDLQLISGQYGIIRRNEKGKAEALERRGDIRMKANRGTYSVILAAEVQNKVHHAMPVRSMLYEAMEYTKQVQDLEKSHKESGENLAGDSFLSGITETDRLLPVVTTVLYSGKEYEGRKSLMELLRLDGDDEETKYIKKYIPDYKIHVISMGNVEHPEKFNSCLQHIFSMLKYNENKKKLYQYVKNHRKDIQKMDDVEMEAALLLLGEQKRLKCLLEENEREEEPDMCKAIDDLISDGKEAGRQEGIREGIKEGIKEGVRALIETCQELGISRLDTSLRVAEKFLVSDLQAEEYLGKYWHAD